jgi:diguanylate cyclase (GGDEF)-like protein
MPPSTVKLPEAPEPPAAHVPDPPDAPDGPVLPRAYDVPLLRLRLRLALLTMAILPTTLAVALASSTLDGQAVTDSLRLADQTEAASRTIHAQLERAAAALVVLAAEPALADALAEPALGQAHIAALLRRPLVGLQRVTLVDRSGDAAFSLAIGGSGAATAAPAASVDQVLALDPGQIHVASVDGTASRLVLSTPVMPGATTRAVGALRFELATGELLSAAMPETGSAGIFLIDRAGALLDSRRIEDATASVPSAEQVVASLAARPPSSGQWVVNGEWRAGTAGLGGEFDGWQVLVVDRFSAPQLPIALFAMLAALTPLVVGIIVWMSRQVIGPAQELARSREQLLEMYEAARADALRDALTGLGNHRAFQEALSYQLEWFDRYKVPFALALLDVDDLKLVNDTVGHSAGDEMLRTVGRLIGETARYADRAFRIGGDEFAIVMPHTSAAGALELGRRLLARAAAEPGRSILFSGGISACPDLATTRDEIYAQADAALYWCKRHGRASLDVFDPQRDSRADHSSAGSQSAQVARAISEGLLRAAYQPVVDLRSGTVIGFEGLTRPMPDSGFADPGELFGAADAAGRSVELDYACLETVVSQAVGLGPEQLLSINLSPRTIEAPQFSADWLVSLLTRHGMDPRRVVIELTEQQGIEDLPRLQRNLAAIQKAGLRVAIDDVGAGNAGLRLLSQFRFDIVKIDLSLVQDGSRRDSSRAVLTSLRELAGRWGAYVVAEGLETVSQLRVVRELGMAAGQGFLLGRPLPAPMLARIDLATIAAGGEVMQVRPREPGSAHPTAARPSAI